MAHLVSLCSLSNSLSADLFPLHFSKPGRAAANAFSGSSNNVSWDEVKLSRAQGKSRPRPRPVSASQPSYAFASPSTPWPQHSISLTSASAPSSSLCSPLPLSSSPASHPPHAIPDVCAHEWSAYAETPERDGAEDQAHETMDRRLQGKQSEAETEAASLLHHSRSQHQPYGVPESLPEPPVWDVVGLGQAMVDLSAMVPHSFLDNLGLPRGERVVVDHHERGLVLQALHPFSFKPNAGGSLSNTLVALARLGRGKGAALSLPPLKDQAQGQGLVGGEVEALAHCQEERRQLHVAMVGTVGSDPQGGFYRNKLLRANVRFLSPPLQGGTTGTVIVLTTPDAQRTMLSYQGMSSEVTWDEDMEAVVAKSRMLVVEGYLWELAQTVDAIEAACAAARSKGLLVALTASDASCVLRHRPKFWSVLCRSAHVLFANASEARALAGCAESTSTAALTQHLSRFCPLVSVTDGEAGSYLGLRGEVVHIPAQPCVAKDTCGAGDAYAAGVLYTLLMGAPDLESIGRMAARVSAVVVGQQGTRLGEKDAQALVDELGFEERALVEGQVFHSMMGFADVGDASVVSSAVAS